jgi:hypothetical protein
MFVQDVPDTIGEVSEDGNGARDTVLSLITLYQTGFCGMNGLMAAVLAHDVIIKPLLAA